MKTNLKITKLLMIILLVAASSACKKDENKDEVDELQKLETLNKKIQDIIPTKYLDSLKKLGLVINTGTNPVNVEGIYSVKPMILLSTNVKNDFRPGHKFADARTKLFAQTENLDIKLIGKNFISVSDTSLVTAISGTDEQFTVYGKIKSTQNGKVAMFAIIYSAIMDGNTLRDMQYGLICIENKNLNDNTFIAEGTGRVIYESDRLSDRITEGQFLAQAGMQNKLIPFVSFGALKPDFLK